MREILFRGKDIVGNWYAGNLAVIKQDFHNGAGTIEAGSYISNAYGVPFAYQVRPETVGQFTGLTDKNRVKIFEGDIMLLGNVTKRKTVIEYDSLRAQFFASMFDKISIRMSVSFWNTGEVIGNMHDNPELLP